MQSYKCSRCTFRTTKLGNLRGHHEKVHPRTYGKSVTNLWRRQKTVEKHMAMLPTIDKPTPPKLAATGGVNFCPHCGHNIKRFR